MTEFQKLQEMAKQQTAMIARFDALYAEMLAMAETIKTSEPKTSQFLQNIASSGLRTLLSHYLLESRSNIKAQGEKVTTDDIMKAVGEEDKKDVADPASASILTLHSPKKP